jgi:arsenite methyltransferase
MTPEMLSNARKNVASGGYQSVEFRLGEIENLPVADNTADVVISNCVINLSPSKLQVYKEAHRVLKPGGRLAVSDMVALQPLPDSLKNDLAAYTGCVADAELTDQLKDGSVRPGLKGLNSESASAVASSSRPIRPRPVAITTRFIFQSHEPS